MKPELTLTQKPQSPAAQAFIQQKKATWEAKAQALATDTAQFVDGLHAAVHAADEKALSRLAKQADSLRKQHKAQGELFSFDVLLGAAFEAITPRLLLHAAEVGTLPPIAGVIPRGVEQSHRDFTLQLPDGRTVDLDVKATIGRNICLETLTEGGNVGWFPRMADDSLILSARVGEGRTQLLLIPVRSLRQPQRNGEAWYLANAITGEGGRRERHNTGDGRGTFYLLPPEKVEKLSGVRDLTATWKTCAATSAQSGGVQ